MLWIGRGQVPVESTLWLRIEEAVHCCVEGIGSGRCCNEGTMFDDGLDEFDLPRVFIGFWRRGCRVDASGNHPRRGKLG